MATSCRTSADAPTPGRVAKRQVHPAHTHPVHDRSDAGGWVGVDLGLSAFMVAATLADRVFTCGCGHSADRDTNAATNLARWAADADADHHDLHLEPRTPKQRGRVTNARRRDGTDRHPSCAGETSSDDVGTDVHTAPAA